MSDCRVGILGATGFVGRQLSPRLTEAGCRVTGWSRQSQPKNRDAILWRRLGESGGRPDPDPTPWWICVAPVWVLPEHFSFLESHDARRIVAVSSTSRFTKAGSSEAKEQKIAGKLADAEDRFRVWAEKRGVEWVILRPTLIYGLGRDANVTVIARFIKRFGFFPIVGPARGLRQPIHVDDVAAACVTALLKTEIANRAYNLPGGETISYCEMVKRIFASMKRPDRILSVPLPLFRGAIVLARLFPRYRYWTPAMAQRMNHDMVFDHSEAVSDLNIRFRPFVLTKADLPL